MKNEWPWIITWGTVLAIFAVPQLLSAYFIDNNWVYGFSIPALFFTSCYFTWSYLSWRWEH